MAGSDESSPIDFTAPGFALTARMSDIHVGPSWFFYTTDKGTSWSGPYALPDFGQKGIAARTDYLVDGRHALTMFLTAAKSNGREGRVICVRTTDGGRTRDVEQDIAEGRAVGGVAAIAGRVARVLHAHLEPLIRERAQGRQLVFVQVQLQRGAGFRWLRIRRQALLGGSGAQVRQQQEGASRDEEGEGGAGDPERRFPHSVALSSTGTS